MTGHKIKDHDVVATLISKGNMHLTQERKQAIN